VQGDRWQGPLGQHLLEPPGRQILPHRKLGLDRQTETCQHRRRERIGVVGAQRTGWRYLRFLASGTYKAPDLGRGRIGVAKTIVVSELGRMGRATPPVEIRWRADDESPNLAQPPRNQAGIPQNGDP